MFIARVTSVLRLVESLFGCWLEHIRLSVSEIPSGIYNVYLWRWVWFKEQWLLSIFFYFFLARPYHALFCCFCNVLQYKMITNATCRHYFMRGNTNDQDNKMTTTWFIFVDVLNPHVCFDIISTWSILHVYITNIMFTN